MLYAAYGSNLNIRQMEARCPDARIVCTAEYPNMRLVFRGPKGGAVATIEPHSGTSVPLAIWDISKWDEYFLDIYEGWPRLYRKEYIEVMIDGEPEIVMIYLMNDGRPYNTPSKTYFETIEQGYKDFGIKPKRLVTFLLAQLDKAKK